MIIKRLTLALTLILSAAIFWGGWTACSLVSHMGYFSHHMYLTCARILAHQVDRCALYSAAGLLTIWVLFATFLRFKGFVRWIVLAIPIVTLLKFSGLVKYLRDVFNDNLQWIRFSLIRDMFVDGAPQIIACCVLAVAGVYMIRRRRCQANADSNKTQIPVTGREPSASRLHRMYCSLTLADTRKPLIGIIIPLVLAVNFMPFLFHAKNVASVKKKPNIIFIMVDTLRADHLRCYGYSRNTSPNIDQFAKEGMRFERAIAQAPWTSASVSSFMSSRYLRIRYKYGPQGIPDDVVLLPQALRDNGYTTAASISNPLAGRMAGLDRGYDLFYQANEDISNYSKRSEGVLSSAAKQLDKIGNGRFFLFVLFMDPHGPYMWRENHQFDPEYKGKLGKQPFLADGSMSAEDHRYVVSLYDSGIAAADDYVGELIGYLKKKKLYDDTLIVFLSDHGEELNEHDVWGHGLHLYDESISVPFIVKMPEQKQGQVVKGTFSLIDLFPSVMDYIGCDVKSYGLQGTSVPFSGLKHMRETEIYSSTLFKDVNSESLRSSTRKYIKEIDRGNLEQYFDLSNDPLEMHNLALRCRPSDILQQRRSMSQKDEAIDAALASAVSTSHRLSSKDTTALRSLGYLQ